jgi:hypothetical protein
MQYRKMTDPDDCWGAQVIMNSIEKCWVAVDQEIFITAGIHALLNCLWRHFYNENPPAALSQQIAEYLQQTGLFSNLASSVQIHLNANSKEVCLICLQKWRCTNDRK